MSKSPKPKIVLFLGSARAGRMGLRVSKFIQKHLTNFGFEVDLFDPTVLKLPVLEQPLHFYRNPADAPQMLVQLNDRLKKADGYMIVSPEYNHAIPPALSNMMNHFPPHSYAFKASAIVTYSISKAGGVAVGAQLRDFLSTLGCPSIPFVLSIPEVDKALDEKGDAQLDYLEPRAAKAVDQFKWMVMAFKEKRTKNGAPEYFL